MHLVKDRFELPIVTDKNMIHYRDTTFPDKKSDAYQACDYALRHWQRYLNENKCPNHLIASRDISKFCSELEPLEPVTIYNIIGQLQRFFDHEDMNDAIDRIEIIKDNLKTKIKKVYYPLRYEQLIELYRLADEEDKVLIRFLLLQKEIRIKDIPKIEFIPKDDKYRFIVVEGKSEKRLDVDSQTIDVASTWLQKKNSERKNPERLFNFNNPRSVAEHIEQLEQQLNKRLIKLGKAPLDYPLYAKNIQRYGWGLDKTDLLNWLSIASKADTCPACGRELKDSHSFKP